MWLVAITIMKISVMTAETHLKDSLEQFMPSLPFPVIGLLGPFMYCLQVFLFDGVIHGARVLRTRSCVPSLGQGKNDVRADRRDVGHMPYSELSTNGNRDGTYYSSGGSEPVWVSRSVSTDPD